MSCSAPHSDLVLFAIKADASQSPSLFSLFSDADIADLADCKISSDGGTGSTTRAELTVLLLRRTTSIGPLMLFR